MSDFTAKITAELDTSKAEQQINEIGKGKTVKLNVDTGNAQSNINKVNTAMQSSKRTASSFGDTLKKSLNIGSSAAITAKSIHLINNAAKDAIKAVKDIDGAITNLRMATGDSYSEVEKLVKGYNQLGQAMGATTTEVSNSADAWLRQGNTIKQTNTLIRDSMVLAKVGQLDSADATKYLTSAMKGYKIAVEDVSGIVDKLTAVDLMSATDAGGLAEAMSRTAVTANEAGVSMDKLIGYLATVGEVTQKSMSSVGESFKTIFTRMSDIKSDKLELIDEAGTTELLSDVELTLKNVGIDLRSTVTEYNSYGDVLDNLASKWDTLSQVQQNALAKAFAGTRQAENFRVLMENYDSAKAYMDTAINSAGTAEQKFAAYADSIEAKTKSLQAAFEALSVDTFSTEMVGNIIDATKAVVSFLDETNLLKGALSGLAVGAAVKGFTSVASGISSAAMKMSQFNAALKLVKAGNIGEQQIQQLAVMTSNLSDSQLKAVLSSQALSAEQRIAILTTQGMSTAEAQAAVSSMGLATSQGAATASTLTLSGALKGLWATLLANPFILIIAGVTAAATAFYSYNQAIEESIDAAYDAAMDFKDVSSSMSDNIDRIKELRQVLANTDSEQEAYDAKSELLSIQQQLTESYGAEAAGINLVNGELETQIGILQNLSKSKADAFLNENADAIAKAEKEMTKTLGGEGNWVFEPGEVLGVFADNQSEEVEKIKGIIEKYKDYLKVDDMQDGTFRIRFVGDATEAKTVLNDVMTDIRNAKDELGGGFYLDELFDNAGIVLEGANEILDKYQDIYEQAQAAKLISDTKEFSYGEQKGTAAKWLNDYTKAVENYNAALASGDTSKIDEAKNKFNALDTAVQSLLSNSDMSEYADDFGAIKEQLDTVAIAANSFRDALNGVNITDANRVISNFADTIKDANITDIDFEIGVANPSDDTALGAAISGITFEAEKAGISVDGLISMLGELGIISTDVSDETISTVDTLSGTLEDFYAILNNTEDGNFTDSLEEYTDRLDTLKEAIADFNSGNLSDSDIVELMKQFPKLTQYAEDLGTGLQTVMQDILGSNNSAFTGSIDVLNEKVEEFKSAYQNLVDEQAKIQEWGLTDFGNAFDTSGNSFVQHQFGNIDMDKRAIITWSDELKQTYADALSSWDYNPEIGSIDTVFGGSERFGESVLKTGVEVAFTPIMNVDGQAQFLDRGTVCDYIEQLVGESTIDGVFSEEKMLDLDRQGKQIGDTFVQGIIAAADESLNYENNGNWAETVGRLMHFSGDTGAIALAYKEIGKAAESAGMSTEEFLNSFDYAIDEVGVASTDTSTLIGFLNNQISELGENTAGAEAMRTLRDEILKLYDTANKGFSFDITAEIGNMDNLFGAMSESYSPTGLSTESISNIKNMFSGMKGYDQSVLFEHTANGIHLNSDALRELQAQYEATKKIGFQEELESLKQQYNDTKDELQSLTEGTEEYNQKNSELSDIEQRINDVSTLATQYEGLTSAYNKWIQAQSAGEEGDMYDQMRDGLEDAKELYEQGLIGTNAFRTYTDLLSSEDLSTADAYEVEAAYQKLGQTIEGTSYSALDFLAEGSDGCLNFLNATQQLNDEWVHMNEDGSWNIDFGVGGDKEVADALGIDVEYLQSIMRKLHDYGFDINLDNAYASVEELQSKVEKTEEVLTNMGEKPVDIDVNAKDVDSEIEKAKEKIEEISESDVDVNVKDAQLADAQAKLDVLIQKKIQASQPSFMTIDVSQVDGNMQNTLLLLQNYQQAVNNLNALELKGADTSEIEAAKSEVDELAGQLASLDGDTKVSIGLEKDASVEDIKSAISADEITVPISADITSVTETIEGVNGKEVDLTVNTSGKDAVDELSGAIDALEGKTVEVKANVKGESQVTSLHNAIKALVGKIVSVTANVFGKSDVDALRESIRNTNSKTVTITTNRTTNIVTNRVSEAQGTAHANGTAFATGNISTKDSGIAFGGEVGQEMVVRDGKFFTIGDDSAEFFRYKKGDIIFNAGQTAQIFKYGKIKNGKKRGEAFADGTAFSRGSGAIHSSGRVVTVGSVNGGGSGGNGGSGGGNSKGKTAADAFADWLSGLFDWAEIRLNRLNRLTEKWTTKAEQAVRYSYNQTAKDSTINKQYSNRASYTKKAITATENNIVGNQKAIASYNSMLKKIKSKGGLSAKTINKIKNDTVNGTFDIQSFDKDSKQLKAIQAYQEWYEKILDCTDAISELKETQKDLYDQLYNIPIEQATAKVEKYENAITRLNAAMSATSGGSKIYLRQTVRDAQTNFNSANTAADKTQKAYNSAKKTQDKAQKSFNSKKKTMSKTKGLSKSQKASVKAGKAIDTKGLKGKALKNAEAYNKSLTALNKAKSATSSAKQSNSLAQANKRNAQASLDEAKTIQNRYANSPEYEYQNYLLDQETAQKKKENSAQQAALRTANKNLSDAEKAKNSADKSKASKKKTVDTKSSSILKKYEKKLSKSQKADLKAGNEVSTKGLKGNALKAVKEYNKAVAAYKKSVASATDATTKYNSAVEAQATADQNAAVAQAEYTQAIQENAKAKFDNVATSFESKQSVTEAKISKLNTQLAYRASMGYSQTSDNQKSIYNNAISENQNLLSSQKEELVALKNAYKENSANMSEQDANAAKAQITALEESILSTQGTIADLQSELNKIEVKKLEISMDRLKAKADSLKDAISLKEVKGLSATKSDYNALISNSQKQVTNLQAQNAELQKQQANYSTNSEKYQELQNQIEANEDAIRDAGQSQVEWNNAIATIPYSALENALDLLDTIASNNKSLIDLKSDSGNDLSASDYIQQMQDNNNQIAKLEEERQQALSDYRKALTDSEGVYGGKTADEWKQQYLKLGTEINGILSDNEKLKDSLRDDVYWREFDKAHDAAKRLQDVIEGIADLISDDMIFDKDGKLTQYGIAQIANLTKEYENARTEVKNYSKDIENLNNLYIQGWYTENEYKEKLAELQKGVLDSAASMKDYSDTIIEMYKNMAQSELDALFELIDARNDALDAKADYYDYNKSITEKNRDIQNLNAEIAALEGIDTAEAKAKKAQLEADLAEKQEDLDDVVNDHMLELSQKALDDMKDVLQEAFDDRFEYISSNLDEIVSIMSAANKLTATSASTINSTLNKLLAHYGINANSTGIDAAYATGTTSVPKKLTGLFGEKGDEIAVMDKGLIATFNPGDGVVPSDLTKRLYDMAMGNLIIPNIDVPDITMPDIDMKNIGETNVTQHYDSLINIEGSADAATVEDIKNMKKELLQQSFEYTTRKLYSDTIHAGGKKRV